LAQIASALLSLHESGLAHGDLWGGVNVLAESARGCVLIDPQPQLWGPTSGVGEQRTDLESLVYLIQQLAPEYAHNRFAPVIKTLQDDTSMASLNAALAVLRGAARDAPVVVDSDATFRAAGSAFQAQVRKINEMYKRNRILRKTAITELAMRIEKRPNHLVWDAFLRPSTNKQRQAETKLAKGRF
jgi:hypothetical protein